MPNERKGSAFSGGAYVWTAQVLYDTSKGACHMFARAIAVEFRDKGIRCNTARPLLACTRLHLA